MAVRAQVLTSASVVCVIDASKRSIHSRASVRSAVGKIARTRGGASRLAVHTTGQTFSNFANVSLAQRSAESYLTSPVRANGGRRSRRANVNHPSALHPTQSSAARDSEVERLNRHKRSSEHGRSKLCRAVPRPTA